MMRVIFLLLVSSIALQSKSQTWNNYLQKRFKSYGIWADSVLLVPNDTSLNKTGFAIKGSTAYIGDGVKWTAITGGSSVVDSLGVIIAAKPSFGDVRDVVSDSMGYVRSNFQPLENQRLSTGDNVEFSNVSVKKEIIIGEFGGDDGKIRFIDRGTGNVGNLTNGSLTEDDRSWSLPNQSGEIALTSDINDSINYVRGNYVKYTDTSSMLSGYKSASILSSGTLSDSRLSSNVPLLNANNNFTGTNTFSKSSLQFNDSKTGNVIGILNVAEDNYVGWFSRNTAYGNTRLIDLSNINSITAGGISVSSIFASSYISCNNFSGQLQGFARFVNNSAPLNKKNWFCQTNPNGLFQNYSATDDAVSKYYFMEARKAVSPDYYVANVTYTTVDTFQVNTSKVVLNANTDVKNKLTTGGFATNYRYINDSSYTLTTTTKQINVAATTKNVYINLLTSVGNDGQEWSVRRESDTNQYKVIIKPTSGQKINGADSLILFAQNNNVTLKSDGANYIIVDRYNTAKANTPAAAEDLSNISSVTPKKRIYTQTDSVVSVTEYYEVTLTTAGTASSFAVKTPIPTTFTSIYDAIGVGAVTIVDDFTSPTTRKSASAVITSVNSSNKVLVQLNDDADSGNTKRIVTLNYQYILK